MKVLLRAPLLTNSGYGVHSRQIFEWLLEKEVDFDVECLKWGNTPWIIKPDDSSNIISEIMKRSVSLKKKYDVTFQVQLPDEWNPDLGDYNIGISAFVETDRCNPSWVQDCNRMDHIIVPSAFTRDVVQRSGNLLKPISVVPEWYNHSILNKPEIDRIISKDNRFKFDTSFNIMMMGLLTSLDTETDRKNIVNTLAWLFETFSDKKDVGIVLKTSLGKDGIRDRKMCESIMNDLVKKFRKSPFPKVHLIHGNLTPKEIAALYHSKSVKAFVSATRGEGYGLPIIDAAAAGVPIVATGWSGHFEFLERELVSCVDYTLNEVPKSRIDGQIFLDGFRWAEPNKESFQSQILSVYNDYEKSKVKANALKKKVTQKFHKKTLFKEYEKVLGM